MDNKETTEVQHKRRVRYSGTHPRRFEEKYKELNPEKYKDDVAHIISRGATPAGMHISIMVKEILDFLEDNIYGKITVKDIAEAIGKSESTVKQLFSQYIKSGVMKYYNSLKIKEAKKLIREDNYNMTQISDMLHFDNPQYFSKCFKSFTKMTPSEYKASIMGYHY